MGTPLGDFLRAKRDSTQPESLGLPDRGRRRSPGLRRVDLATRAGISVEYLTRLEQGRDHNPSIAVLNALADALSLSPAERSHLRYLAKITGGGCLASTRHAPREVRPTVRETLRLLEPGIAVVTNRLGDVLAHTSCFEAMVRATGLLDAGAPNLTRYVFADPRARTFFPDWEDLADERAFEAWASSSAEHLELGPEFTRRVNRHVVPRRGVLRLAHPTAGELRLNRETLELPSDGQQLVVFLPADDETAQALTRLRAPDGRLRAIS
ncbi:helix-turn-helix domain-containing protein [Amycolatopsis sacchari]|uniref:Helix-turn-helix domain-containing protein n=1 Tax=Amycolatopsis sacchari TaxID=115433 RepID=A0A1I3MHP7_9PSEU|nr:helix-turn-helix transcriptional regulator [Amycolatopsis sacchari]SFI96664.1 Helix-turn-helix domain-containing protein [Amycolatopsis sacchari]